MVSETDGREPTEVPDYVDSCENRVAASLFKSEPLSNFLYKTYLEDGASLKLTACAEEIAERLVTNPRTALAKLTVARHHFELPYKVDLPALEAIREIVREIVLLIYDPEEIEALRAPLAAGGAVTLTVPAATATAAEVVMARLDRRAALFAKSGDGRWPRGRGAIPLPAETASGLDYMATFAVRIEEQLFHLTLDPEEEQGTSLALKRKLGDAALAGRNEAKDGRLYCILTLDIAKKFAATFDKCIEPLAKDWPRVRFINLDSDPDRHVEEKTLIWALKDYLHDA